MESNIIGRGVGVHSGALSGVAVFSASVEGIKQLKERSGQPVILIRKETNTDDVSLMPEVDGIITAIGGATSHAAVLSRKFNLTSVVGCSGLSFELDSEGKRIAKIGDYSISEGSAVSIDGSTGTLYSGICPVRTREKYY